MSEDGEELVLGGLSGYRLGETIGSGGFGKVKLGTHVVTGERVAVKIVDKVAVGEDLPRIYAELKAMKALWHQNICRLYQAVETEAKIYFVLEYCEGGELFDYIVKKECLAEPEARHFFRQIVAALAYVHSLDYAHRDIKPENILLTGDLQIKIIDFGLCARPDGGLSAAQLETACGSPAYAAPELIKGEAYLGHQVDIWSCGVLLYALLCGQLPFEDDNVHRLYEKIAKGRYAPPRASDAAKSIIRGMLQTDPRRRLDIKAILGHAWLRDGGYGSLIKWQSIYDARLVDEEVAAEMAKHYDRSLKAMKARIRQWAYDHVTATYFLLLERKRKKRPVVLPHSSRPSDPTSPTNLLSPTIHASLEGGLDDLEPLDLNRGLRRLNLDSSDDEALSDSEGALLPEKPSRPAQRDQDSYAKAIVAGARIVPTRKPRPAKAQDDFLKPPPLPDSRPPNATPASVQRRRRQGEGDKENRYSRPAPASDAKPNRANYAYANTPADEAKVKRRMRRIDSRSLDRQSGPRTPGDAEKDGGKFASPLWTPAQATTPGEDRGRSGGKSGAKANAKMGRRMFQSVERKVDRMINLLTPSRGRGGAGSGASGAGMGPGGTQLLSKSKMEGMINVSTTPTGDPDRVMQELLRGFREKGIECEQAGWRLRGKKRGEGGGPRGKLSLELEVVWIEHLGLVGIRRKRLAGDAFMYKRVAEDILNLAQLD